MKKLFMKMIAAAMIVATVVGCFAGCKKGATEFTIATQELDQVFNPFFATSGYDTEVIGMTELGLLTTSPQGEIVAGNEWPSAALDYKVTSVDNRPDKTNEEDYDNYYTTYEIILKNGLKFSDGVPLTIKDVLFNMYLYLDPVYTGSSTMYSTKIKGLSAYRAQSLSEGEQGSFDQLFRPKAKARIDAIRGWCDNEMLTEEQMPEQIKADFEKMKELFREELNSDWASAATAIESYVKEGYTEIDELWEVFFVMENFITLKEEDGVKSVDSWGGMPELIANSGVDKNNAEALKEVCINAVYEEMINNTVLTTRKSHIKSIVTYWVTATNLYNYILADEKSKYFEEIKVDGQLVVPNISGITAETTTTDTAGNDLGAEHQMLKVVVNGVDPKAIYNFSFGISPMHYYAGQAYADKADPAKNNFGVSFGDIDFMNAVRLVQVPRGAGPYRAVNQTTEKTDYFKDNIVRYEANPYYLMGEPKIKRLNYKVINANQLFNAVQNGEVHYAAPDAKTETIQDATNKKNKKKLGTATVENLGYGYIGINAAYIPDIDVRRAIMYTLDPTLTLNYYPGGLASVIYRPMSMVSWAYPEGAKLYYDAVAEAGETNASDAKKEEIIVKKVQSLIEGAGWRKNDKGIYVKPRSGADAYSKRTTDELKLTFTISGESEEHPASQTMLRSQRLLQAAGCKVTITNDPNALKKLSNGELMVWAAAWSSTIDPDMYQVYHKESQATSVNNWGYPFMLNNLSASEDVRIINELSELIDDGRKTNDQAARAQIYSTALDKVMDLAVEFPMYQRKNLFIWDKKVINEKTLVSNPTAYESPIGRIWEVEFN